MADVLSDAELDALLGGMEADTNVPPLRGTPGNTDEPGRILSNEEFHALTEAANAQEIAMYHTVYRLRTLVVALARRVRALERRRQ